VDDTGGLTGTAYAYGIYAGADINDNTIDGVFTAIPTMAVYGIYATASGAQISGNRVGGIAINDGNANAQAFGIAAFNSTLDTIAGNHVAALVSNTPGGGIYGAGPTSCLGNTVARFQTPLQCTAAVSSRNLSH
jgi:hypothetical protein